LTNSVYTTTYLVSHTRRDSFHKSDSRHSPILYYGIYNHSRITSFFLLFKKNLKRLGLEVVDLKEFITNLCLYSFHITSHAKTRLSGSVLSDLQRPGGQTGVTTLQAVSANWRRRLGELTILTVIAQVFISKSGWIIISSFTNNFH
jgi:hypothetical protein